MTERGLLINLSSSLYNTFSFFCDKVIYGNLKMIPFLQRNGFFYVNPQVRNKAFEDTRTLTRFQCTDYWPNNRSNKSKLLT